MAGCKGCSGNCSKNNGNYTYIRYASDENGTDFSDARFSDSFERCYQAVITSNERLNENADDFPARFQNKWFYICDEENGGCGCDNGCTLFDYHKPPTNNEHNTWRFVQNTVNFITVEGVENRIQFSTSFNGTRNSVGIFKITGLLDQNGEPLQNFKKYFLSFFVDWKLLPDDIKVSFKLGDGCNNTTECKQVLSSGSGSGLKTFVLETRENIEAANTLVIEITSDSGQTTFDDFNINDFRLGTEDCFEKPAEDAISRCIEINKSELPTTAPTEVENLRNYLISINYKKGSRDGEVQFRLIDDLDDIPTEQEIVSHTPSGFMPYQNMSENNPGEGEIIIE